MNIFDKIEKWWGNLSETQKLIMVIILFVLMCVSNPFIN